MAVRKNKKSIIKKGDKNSPKLKDDNAKSEISNQDKLQGTNLPTTKEIGGPKGLEPTRYGDWERNGRVSDF